MSDGIFCSKLARRRFITKKRDLLKRCYSTLFKVMLSARNRYRTTQRIGSDFVHTSQQGCFA